MKSSFTGFFTRGFKVGLKRRSWDNSFVFSVCVSFSIRYKISSEPISHVCCGVLVGILFPSVPRAQSPFGVEASLSEPSLISICCPSGSESESYNVSYGVNSGNLICQGPGSVGWSLTRPSPPFKHRRCWTRTKDSTSWGRGVPVVQHLGLTNQ